MIGDPRDWGEALRLEILLAAEALVPPPGGAERFLLEALAILGQRHSVRTLCLEPAPIPQGRYWREKRARRERLGSLVAKELARLPADVVLTQLHAAPAVIEEAARAGTAAVLVLPSYESLCKHAFDAGSVCAPRSGCRTCPAALGLGPEERSELVRSRAAHERALRQADALVAPSSALADTVAGWCGRRASIVRPVTVSLAPLGSRPDGPVVAVAAPLFGLQRAGWGTESCG